VLLALNWGWSPWLGLPAGFIVAMALGVVIGIRLCGFAETTLLL